MAIVFAKPALYALKPIYESAVPVVVFMTIRAVLYVLGGTYNQAMLGIEKVDLNENSTIKDFVKSKLFSVPTMILVQYSVYTISIAVGLYLLKPFSKSDIDLVIYWSIISLATQVPFTVYYYYSTRKYFVTRIGPLILFKYLSASVVSFGITYFLVQELSYKKSIFEFIPNLMLFVFIGIGIYLGITYAVDLRTRKLFHAIINEIRGNSI